MKVNSATAVLDERKAAGRYIFIVALLYGIPNLLGIVVSGVFDILLVDMIPIALTADRLMLFVVVLSIVFSFALIIFSARLSYAFFSTVRQLAPQHLVGYAVFILQTITLVSVISTGYGRAGARLDSADGLAIIASYANSDMFFLLYYAHVRPRRFPTFNFIMYISSSMTRGWSGIWLILILIEVYYILLHHRHRLPVKKLGLFAIAALLSFPILSLIKERVRGSEADSFSYLGSYVLLLNRLQHSTNVTLVAQEANDIKVDYKSGRISPWYASGTLISILASVDRDSDTLEKYLTKNYLVELVESDSFWYSNVGIAGWLFLLPWYEIPVYILYLLALIMLPYWMVGNFLGARSMLPVLHVASFGYVLHGWLAVQVTFVASVAIYVSVTRILDGVAANNVQAAKSI